LDSDDESEDPDYIPEEGEDGTYTEDVAQDFVVELIEEGFITPGVEGPIEKENIEKENIEEENNDETNSESRHEDDEQSTDEVGEPAPDQEPIPREPRRSARAPTPRKFLDPSSGGKSYTSTEVKSYATTAVNHVNTDARTTNVFEYDTDEAHILAMAFAQTYSLSRGIKKFGTEGGNAMRSEMQQLHDRKCFKPVDINSYDPKVRGGVMESIMFLTEKRDGRVKARNVTDGRKQREWMTKEEASKPTVLLEALILSIVNDAKENRDVCVVVDILHAFVQTPNEQVNEEHPPDLMKVKGKLGQMLLQADP
jgi:hypothetical protein